MQLNTFYRPRAANLPTVSLVVFFVFVLVVATAAPVHGQIYVTNYETGTIGAYNLDGTPINTTLITGLDHPQGLAVSGGNIYVSCSDSVSNTGWIGKYTTSGATVNAKLISLPWNPHGVAVSGEDLYVAKDFGYVGKYTTSGATVNANFVTFHTVFPDPLGLAVSGADLYVTNELGNKVGHFTTAGATIDDVMIDTGPSTSPFALAISGSTMFVSLNGGFVSKYTTSGDLIEQFLIEGIASPSGIGALGDRLFVESSFYGTVGAYNLDGTPVNTELISGLHEPIGIAVVPEPTTPALLVFAGCTALLGVRGPRRRRPMPWVRQFGPQRGSVA